MQADEQKCTLYDFPSMTNDRGFIALMSVIIISAILLVLVFTLGLSSFFNRFDTLDSENKRVSLGLAESCVNAAMLKIAQNPSYVPAVAGDCVSVGGTCGGTDPQKVCKICSVTAVGSESTVVVRALYDHAYTNLRITFANVPGTYTVTHWTELAANSVPSCTLP